MSDAIQIRIHGAASLPTLIYLPGLHGNWKLIGGFRRHLADQVRFVEISYPNTLSWSLDEHAAAVEKALSEQGITEGWLLGESFSSQIVWPLLQRKVLRVQGVILAGGFVRHPVSAAVRLSRRFFSETSFFILSRTFYLYAWLTPFRFRRSPETFHEIRQFICGLTPLDVQAFKHRLDLIAANDPCAIAAATDVPVFALTGLFDPVVPWIWVRRWLRRNCQSLREYKVIRRADHNVLGTAPDASAKQVLKWIEGSSKHQDPGCAEAPGITIESTQKAANRV